MQPIPESVEAQAELRRYVPDLDVLDQLQRMAEQVERVVPDCVGMSFAWPAHEVVFTLIASDEQIATLDAIQRFVGGPSPGLAAEAANADDPFDEGRWRLAARDTAHRGVASTLTSPSPPMAG